jgi:serine phosphatase RsbU (regulator of sigma subunit)
MFITAQLAWLSRTEHAVLVANAGHCPMLHRPHGSAEWEAVATGNAGLPLGVLDDEVYQATRHDFAAGDRLVLLTDGLYEVENPAQDMLNVTALARQMATFSHEPPQAFCASLLAWVKEYSGSQTASDDRTLLVVERLSR